MLERILTSPWLDAPRAVQRRLLWRNIGLALAVATLTTAAWIAWRSTAPAEKVQTAPEPTAVPATGVVALSPGKLESVDLQVAPVASRELYEVRRVPGRIEYNRNRRLEVKLPVAGVVSRVLVQPGARVKAGDRLAILTSTEVGLARAEVAAAESQLRLALNESEWSTQIAGNLAELAELLADRPEISAVEKQFDQRTLGEHRDRVLSAYSKLLVAEQVDESTKAVASTGGVSGLLARERHSEREIASAQFAGAVEQSVFDAAQQKLRSEAAREDARRQLDIRQKRLELLLGEFAEIVADGSERDSSELVLRAPMAGIVEERLVTDGAQFTASQVLFALTDTSTLWVMAQVYDREWALLDTLAVKELQVQAPAVPQRTVAARMLFVSVSTSAQDGGVPLVAEFENESGQFRPGMFAWVAIPLSAPRRALAVPPSAIARHDGQDFVFVEEQPGRYRRVNVRLGERTPEAVEVVAGLEAGQRVVERGVFALKSELLLGETDL